MCRAKVMVDLTETSDGECNMQDHMPRALLGTFTKGAIRLTQSGADAFDPHKVSFADILQADQLSKCLLTSYVVEEDWLREQLVNVPRIILVTDGGRRSSQVEKYTLPGSRLTMVHPRFPPFPNYGVMHIKLMLLWYEEAGFLRVVVSSGNLRSEDYDRLQNVSSRTWVKGACACLPWLQCRYCMFKISLGDDCQARGGNPMSSCWTSLDSSHLWASRRTW